MRQEKAKMCGDEGRFDFFQEKQNSHGSRKLRIFYSQADRKGGGSVPLALAKLLSYHQIKDKSQLTPVKSKKNISVKAAKGGCPKKY